MNGHKRVDRMSVISGTLHHQNVNFIHPSKDWAGSGRPIHEGVFSIGSVDRSGNNDPGVGPVWIPVEIWPSMKSNNRGAFGFHDDVNRASARGSAGCIVTHKRSDLEYIINWLEATNRPKFLVVDWGTGFLQDKKFKVDRPAENPVIKPTRMGSLGIELVKHFEGRHLIAYRDPAGIWTIGYGHTETVRPGQQITEAQAEALLREDINEFETVVRRAVQTELSPHQFDALVSFAFNVGATAFRGSTLLRLLNEGYRQGAADQFLRWNKATIAGNLVVLPGLVRRRKAERHLFLTGKNQFHFS